MEKQPSTYLKTAAIFYYFTSVFLFLGSLVLALINYKELLRPALRRNNFEDFMIAIFVFLLVALVIYLAVQFAKKGVKLTKTAQTDTHTRKYYLKLSITSIIIGAALLIPTVMGLTIVTVYAFMSITNQNF